MNTTDDGTETRYEEFSVSGADLLQKVRELIREGNVRRVFIKNTDGRTVLEIPLTAGVAITAVTAAIAPALVAVGAVAALLTQVTVGVERHVAPDEQEVPAPGTPEPRDPAAGPTGSTELAAGEPETGTAQ